MNELRFHAQYLLRKAARDRDYEFLDMLYHRYEITNEELIAEEKNNDGEAYGSPLTAIYHDLASVAAAKAASSRENLDFLVRELSERYPDVYSFLSGFSGKAGPDRNDAKAEALYLKIARYMNNLKEEDLRAFACASIFIEADPGLSIFADIARESHIGSRFSRERNLSMYKSAGPDAPPPDLGEEKTRRKRLYSPVFPDGEEVLSSPAFDRFLAKRRREIAEYLGIPEEGLDEYYIQTIADALLSEDGDFDSRAPLQGVAAAYTADFLSVQGMFPFSKKFRSTAAALLRDGACSDLIENAFDCYFIGFIIERYDKCSSDAPFTKLVLARECIPGSAEVMYNGTLRTILQAIAYKMLCDERIAAYESFSPPKHGRKYVEALEKERADLRRDIAVLEKNVKDADGRLRRMKEKKERTDAENTELRTAISKVRAEGLSAESRTRKALEAELGEKDAEIEHLKMKIEAQERLCEYLESDPDDEEGGDGINYAALSGKRILFAGNLYQKEAAFKRIFPSASFVDNKNTSVSGVKADAVVVLTGSISHALYYKVCAVFRGVPMVYCRTNNVEAVCGKLQKLFSENSGCRTA